MQKKTNLKLVIIGDGNQLAELKNLSNNLNLKNKIIFKGYVENPLPYMKNAKLFVSFSNYEGQPNAVIQSIGCGTKTVLKNYPGIPSIIKKSKQVKII